MKQPMIYNKGINTIQGNTSFFASFSILSLAGSDNLLTSFRATQSLSTKKFRIRAQGAVRTLYKIKGPKRVILVCFSFPFVKIDKREITQNIHLKIIQYE